MNYAAVDPVLTNEKCSYWHFRWDASSDIKMEALTNFMKMRPHLKKLYLSNQDSSFGQSVRRAARQMLAANRPDAEIVGDELHPPWRQPFDEENTGWGRNEVGRIETPDRMVPTCCKVNRPSY